MLTLSPAVRVVMERAGVMVEARMMGRVGVDLKGCPLVDKPQVLLSNSFG